MRAARNGRSMEQEARELLKTALSQPEPRRKISARRFSGCLRLSAESI